MTIDHGKCASAKRLSLLVTCQNGRSYADGKSFVAPPRVQPTAQWLSREGLKLSTAAAEPHFTFLQPATLRPAEPDKAATKDETRPSLAGAEEQARRRPSREVSKAQQWGSAARATESRVSSARESNRNVLKLIGL